VFVQKFSWRAGAVWLLQAMLATTVAACPWIVLHLPHYLRMSFQPSPLYSEGTTQVVEHVDLFSTEALGYGATFANYTALLGLAILAALWASVAMTRKAAPQQIRGSLGVIAGAITAVLSFAILVVVMAPSLAGVATDLRYEVPFLLGIVPTIVVLAISMPLSWSKPARLGIPLIAAAATAIAFVPSAIERYAQAMKYRQILAFSLPAQTQTYINYNRYALSQAAEDEIRSLQSKIPAGEPLAAWISQPFHLDFQRNQIFDVDQAGLATSWAILPPRVVFVLWEYKGYGVGTPQNFIAGAQVPGRHEQLIALSAFAFGTALNARAKDGEIVYYDDRFVIYRLRTEQN
jgi:hypothetical protein